MALISPSGPAAWLTRACKGDGRKNQVENVGRQKELGRPPWLLKYRSSKVFILFTVGMAVFTDIFLLTVIVPVLPFALSSRTGIPQSQVQSWVSILIAVYGGSLAFFAPLCGWAADKVSSRRSPLVLGLLALGGSTMMLNLGRSLGVLCTARILQGLSGAVVWVVGFALVADSVEKHEIAEKMGYVFIGLSMGNLLGPLLGGIVFEKAGYNAVYGVAYALIGLDIALRLLMIEKKSAKKWAKDDVELSMVNPAATSVSKSQDAIAEAGESPEDQVQILPAKGATSIEPAESTGQGSASIDTINHPSPSSTSPNPTRKRLRLPPVITLLSSPRLLTSLWAVLVLATILTQFDSTLPLHLKNIFGWNSLGAGLIFLAVVIPSFLGPLVGRLCDRYGNRWTCVAGFLLIIPSEACLRFVAHDSLGQKVLLCALLAIIGLALDMINLPTLAETMLVVLEREDESPGEFGGKGAYASAYGLFNSAFALGCLVGPVWAGFVNEAAGWGTMTWSLALLAGVSAVPCAVWVGGNIFKERKKRRIE